MQQRAQSVLLVVDDGESCELRVTYRHGAPMRLVTDLAHDVLEHVCELKGGPGDGGDDGGGEDLIDPATKQPAVH
jgi:hypothetical protein